jgi:O-antigen/teichoic acid export membrane protein
MKTSLQAAMAAINLYSEYFLGLIVSMTIARHLSTEDYGIYSSIIWLAGLMTLAINAGVSLNVTKFIAEFKHKNSDALPAVIAYFWRIQYSRLLIVALIVFTILFFDLADSNIEKWLLILLFFSVAIKADYMFRVSIFKGIKRFDIIAKTSLIANPFNIVAVLLCAFISPKVESFIIVYCSACIVYGMSTRFFNKQLPLQKYNNEHIAEHKQRIMFQVISATIIVLLGALIFRQSQVFVLEENNFLSEAGFFNIAFLLSTAAITLVPGIYQEILLPKITEAVQDGNVKSQVAQAERYLLTLSLLVVVPVVLYADVIIELLFGSRYLPAVFPLQMMMIFKTIITLNQGANLTLISNDKQVSMAMVHVALFIFACAISFFIVPQWGLDGSVAIFGLLVVIMLFSYKSLAARVGYQMISFMIASRLVSAAAISAIPAIIINQYLDGILSAVIGSIVFALSYINLLFIFKGFDQSVLYILKKIVSTTPKPIKAYLSWGIKCLS